MKTKPEVIGRLLKYRQVMQKMKELGFIRVFSDNLADAVGVSASLVRKDFSIFGLTGNKRGGYTIDDLLSQLNKLLGKDEKQQVVIVGCGKMGRALMSYNGFPRVGIRVMAGFDRDLSVLDDEAAIPILHVSQMKEYILRNSIQVAVLTVPESSAPAIIESLKTTSIRGVINFAPVSLRSSADLLIQNINIEQELENIFYQIHFSRERTIESLKTSHATGLE